jgi:hypothetical protein
VNAERVLPLPCGDATLIVWLLPLVQLKFCGAVTVVPSTTTCSPEGLLEIVTGVRLAVALTVSVKFAVPPCTRLIVATPAKAKAPDRVNEVGPAFVLQLLAGGAPVGLMQGGVVSATPAIVKVFAALP